jgi:predicted membrane chloride channel (bestrophin family)
MCGHVGSNSFYSVVLPPVPSKTTTTRKMAKGRIYLFSFLTSFQMVGESLHFSTFLHSSSVTILQVAIEAL